MASIHEEFALRSPKKIPRKKRAKASVVVATFGPDYACQVQPLKDETGTYAWVCDTPTGGKIKSSQLNNLKGEIKRQFPNVIFTRETL